MRFVPIKTVEQQRYTIPTAPCLLPARWRHHARCCQESVIEEFVLVTNCIANLAKLAQQALSDENGLPSYARTTLEALVRQIMTLSEEITTLDRKLLTWHAESEASQRLTAIPGLGIITATAIAATVTDPDQFRSGRQFAAWLGLTPQRVSTGAGQRRRHLQRRGLDTCAGWFVARAKAVITRHNERSQPWHGQPDR